MDDSGVQIQIYNKQEARNSRVFLGIVLGAAFLFAAYEVWSGWSQNSFGTIVRYPISWGDVLAGTLIVIGAVATFVVINTPKVVDFCSSVESELRKVTWPTGRQVVNATVVVLVGILIVTVALVAWDFVISTALSYLGIYPRG